MGSHQVGELKEGFPVESPRRAGQIGRIQDLLRSPETLSSREFLPSGPSECLRALSLGSFSLSFLGFSISHFVPKPGLFVNFGLIVLLLAMILMILGVAIEMWKDLRKARDFQPRQRGKIRRDLDRANVTIARLEGFDLADLRLVQSHLQFVAASRKNRMSFAFGALEKVGLLPSLATWIFAAMKWDQSGTYIWIWLPFIFFFLFLSVVQVQDFIEELEFESWMIGAAIQEGEADQLENTSDEGH